MIMFVERGRDMDTKNIKDEQIRKQYIQRCEEKTSVLDDVARTDK